MNRVALVASASLLSLLGLGAGARFARADDSAASCVAKDTCDGITIGGGCTTLASDAGPATTGFCAPSTECDGSAVLCLPALGTTDAGDAGACVSDVPCTAKDAGDICTQADPDSDGGGGGGTTGACVLSTCASGGSFVTCGAATSAYGCDGKQANAPCMTGPGNAGFCIPLTLDDGSVDELECDVDVATDGPDCRVGGSSAGQLSTAATIGAGLLLGFALSKKRKR